MMVVDASVVVKALTREPHTAAARDLLVEQSLVLAPELLQLEIASALSKKVRYFDLPVEQALAAMDALPLFVPEMVPIGSLILPAFHLSLRLSHAAQDCIYLALAIERGCRMATSDLKFAARVADAGMDEHLVTVGAR